MYVTRPKRLDRLRPGMSFCVRPVSSWRRHHALENEGNDLTATAMNPQIELAHRASN